MTRRRELILAAVGAALLAAGARLVSSAHGPMRDFVLENGCRSPIRVLEPRGERSTGAAVVFHGLSANRRIMQALGGWLAAQGLRVYLIDLPGHGDSTERLSASRERECAAAVLDSLALRQEISPDRTLLVGHSLGGAIAVRLADRFPTAGTIALSPGPAVLPRRMPSNLFVLSAEFDPAFLRQAAQELLRAAGGQRNAAQDFPERRAVKFVLLPWATHTSILFDPRVGRAIGEWARQSLGEPGRVVVPPGHPVIGGALGLAGSVLLFPLAAGLLAALFDARGVEPGAPAPPPAGGSVLRWAVAALCSASLLTFWVPLRVLRLYSGDYLASFLLLGGIVLLALLRREAKAALHFEVRALVMACALGLLTVLGAGAWLNWQLTDAWMNAARWWRFLGVLLVSVPYFAAEEVALGALAAKRSWPRFILFLILRLELWLALVFALYAFGSGQLLILLLAVYLAAFSIFQRLGADAIRRRTGSATAAAAIGAILAAWFLASVLPLT